MMMLGKILPLALASLLLLAGMPSSSPSASAEPADSLVLPAEWSAAGITRTEKDLLDLMRRQLESDPALNVLLTGHTDTIGSRDENLSIGYYYAERTARQLVSLGFPRARFLLATAGESSPLVTTGGFREQAANRRVVVQISSARTAALAGSSASASGKRVLITEPAPGTTDRAYQRIRALVEGGARTALLTVNNVSQIIAVQNSRVEGEAVLDRGSNTIEITAWDETGASGKDRVDIEYVPPPPQVTIITPRNGDLFDTTESPVIKVQGKVESPIQLKEAFLFLNGAPRRIQVDRDGGFTQPIVLIQEESRLRVEAVDLYGKVATSEEIMVHSITLAPKDLVVFLTWDRNGVDLDLHALGPDGKHTFYGGLDTFDSPDAVVGGALDIDNKIGYGPEVFTLAEEKKGIYTFEARYHHSPSGDSSQAQVTVVLHPADPARRVTRVFGPRTLSPGDQDTWSVTRIRMPEGIFEETGAGPDTKEER